MRKRLSEFILGISLEHIKENVVLAPCWTPESVGISDKKLVSDQTCKIWNCRINNSDFTYIVSGVGASVCMDIVMALKETNCKRILFIGSAGALKERHNIGDFAVPSGIISAEGASRYIGDDLSEDIFGKYYFPSKELYTRLLKCLNEITQKEQINLHDGIGISVESILLQYKHIDDFSKMRCDFIDMESSAFLAASNNIGIDSAVVFCISDNVKNNEPLYNIEPEKTYYRKMIRKKVMPFVLKEFLYDDNKKY